MKIGHCVLLLHPTSSSPQRKREREVGARRREMGRLSYGVSHASRGHSSHAIKGKSKDPDLGFIALPLPFWTGASCAL
ncbi:hypothetical protein IE53DRAFT_383635 [Violaceomyces palustris]|uniref:Uncharacterized protein n=1 Tax=Violaceomyces palustris TaxID=1673888 RepID=A0ACD0P703_9BASI|nr:hypothetical protein IE53DRAFT_383635 [Violaceomyces palustris]